MSFIDVLIPLLGGFYLLMLGEKLVKPGASLERNKKLIKTMGIVLIAVSIILLIVKLVES